MQEFGRKFKRKWVFYYECILWCKENCTNILFFHKQKCKNSRTTETGSEFHNVIQLNRKSLFFCFSFCFILFCFVLFCFPGSTLYGVCEEQEQGFQLSRIERESPAWTLFLPLSRQACKISHINGKNPAKHVKSPASVGKNRNNCLTNFQCNPKNRIYLPI